jgi:hypothetical protein
MTQTTNVTTNENNTSTPPPKPQASEPRVVQEGFGESKLKGK